MDIIPTPPPYPLPRQKTPPYFKNDADANTCMKFICIHEIHEIHVWKSKINKINKKPQIITEKFSGNSLQK